MITKKNKLVMGALLPVIATSGCTSGIMERSDKEIDENSSQVSEKMVSAEVSNVNSGSRVIKDRIYVAGSAYHLTDKEILPDFFTNKVSFNQIDPVSFQEITGMISEELGTRIVVTDDAIKYINNVEAELNKAEEDSPMMFEQVDQSGFDHFGPGDGLGGHQQSQGMSFSERLSAPKFDLGGVGSSLTFSIDHNGTISSLLNLITNKANVFWRWNNNHIEIFRQQTKTFIFDGDATTSTFEASISSKNDNSPKDDDGGGNSSSSMNKTEFKTEASSIYDDIEKVIATIASDDGKSSISRSTGRITITDTPRAIELFSRYIESINAEVNKKIAIRAEVYEISSDETGNFGIDWNALYSGSNRFSLNLETAIAGASGGNIEFGVIDNGSNFNGTKAFINAINTMSKISLVTSTSVFTTNGQTAPVQIADERHYLRQMKTEKSEDSVSTELTPGSILSGFTMTVNPRINSKGDIAMRFAVDMTQLNGITDLSVDDSSLIQLPDLTSKNFVQRVILGSGKTMMIAGFERVEKNNTVSSLGNKKAWIFGGKKEGGERKIMTMILLTPYVMAD